MKNDPLLNKNASEQPLENGLQHKNNGERCVENLFPRHEHPTTQPLSLYQKYMNEKNSKGKSFTSTQHTSHDAFLNQSCRAIFNRQVQRSFQRKTPVSDLRIVCISDTHMLHHHLKIPDGDILIHAGDFTNHGTIEEVEDFNAWLGTLPHRHKIVIAGNHDRLFQSSPQTGKKCLSNAIYLRDELIEIEDLLIYGSPWMPWIPGQGAFYLPQESKLLEQLRKNIPAGVHILVTHTPPAGILDEALSKNQKPRFVGCQSLQRELPRIEPRFHVFGHVHEGYGYKKVGKTWCINASIGHSRRRMNLPITVYYSKVRGALPPLTHIAEKVIIRGVLRRLVK